MVTIDLFACCNVMYSDIYIALLIVQNKSVALSALAYMMLGVI